MRKLHPEEIEQIAFIKWLNLKGVFHFAIVNENTMSSKNKLMALSVASRSKKMGKLKGVSDLIIMLPDKVLFIEMKRARKLLKSGKKSNENLLKPEQKEFLETVSNFEYAKGFVAYGASEAINIIEHELIN